MQKVVSQDNYLFNRSIRENIRMGRPSATDAEVEQAAKLLLSHEKEGIFPTTEEASLNTG